MDVESGIRGLGIRNPRTWNPESTAWNPESKALLDYLTWANVLLNFVQSLLIGGIFGGTLSNLSNFVVYCFQDVQFATKHF